MSGGGGADGGVLKQLCLRMRYRLPPHGALEAPTLTGPLKVSAFSPSHGAPAWKRCKVRTAQQSSNGKQALLHSCCFPILSFFYVINQINFTSSINSPLAILLFVCVFRHLKLPPTPHSQPTLLRVCVCFFLLLFSQRQIQHAKIGLHLSIVVFYFENRFYNEN